MPSATSPADRGIPEGDHCFGGDGIDHAGWQIDALGLVVGNQLGVGVGQQLHALCCAVVPHAVGQRKAVLRISEALSKNQHSTAPEKLDNCSMAEEISLLMP